MHHFRSVTPLFMRSNIYHPSPPRLVSLAGSPLSIVNSFVFFTKSTTSLDPGLDICTEAVDVQIEPDEPALCTDDFRSAGTPRLQSSKGAGSWLPGRGTDTQDPSFLRLEAFIPVF
jgi:hypothetical protein